ncbi:hypothetical protein HK413_01525 [Mucilaginibacter sp. S1162]|uniref:Uncharacterized protein n=1 Tax=Mucilaginibacter humi TaxID=2732510 RepID=A0ABX1VYY6_9SPHI|nr:hypothetical protein [Mucilaginibacter humi]NNU33182.1 hypothetical protein [Mucilaginibacter humi]
MGEELPVEYITPFAEIPRGNMPVNKPVYALQNWANNLPQEKAYLHMDKPYYALGDTIWFKGYLTMGSRHQLSSKSGAVYIDLIDEQNKALKTLKLPVNQGNCCRKPGIERGHKSGQLPRACLHPMDAQCRRRLFL